MKSLHLLRQEEGKSSLYFGFEISDLRLISQTTAEISKRKQELGKQQIKSKNPKAKGCQDSLFRSNSRWDLGLRAACIKFISPLARYLPEPLEEGESSSWANGFHLYLELFKSKGRCRVLNLSAS
jgi:hypothetical protein